MSLKTVKAAISAMTKQGGQFTSRGKARVTVGVLPHDPDTAQFIVGGMDIFKITFVGHRGEFYFCGFGTSNISVDESVIAVQGVNFMLKHLNTGLSAKLKDDTIHLYQDEVRLDEVDSSYRKGPYTFGFDLKKFYASAKLKH